MPLKLEGISSDLQTRLGVPSEIVIFERLQYGRYSDGIKFANVKEISLQFLGSGVTIALVQAEEKTKSINDRENVLELIA
jgi:CRISPR/Cas system CMR-associated protein Cmr3 (group 5 of RAMP superfamily)